MKNLFSALFLFLFQVMVFAQKPSYHLDFHSFADNREYFNPVQFPQTIFGFRVSPTSVFTIEDKHILTVGFNGLYEFGDKIRPNNIDPTIFYHYKNEQLQIKMGAFPRNKEISNYPLVQLYDTINYYRPNIEGMLIKLGDEKKEIKVWADWVSRQTETQREQFLAGLVGKIHLNQFYLTNHFVMFHNAGTSIKSVSEGIEDNWTNVLGAGYSFNTQLDSLSLSLNYVQAYEKIRKTNELKTPSGFISYFFAQKKWFSVRNTFYRGQSINQTVGDHFYRAKRYNRTDFSFRFFDEKNVQAWFSWSIHLIGSDLNNQQVFQIKYHL